MIISVRIWVTKMAYLAENTKRLKIESHMIDSSARLSTHCHQFEDVLQVFRFNMTKDHYLPESVLKAVEKAIRGLSETATIIFVGEVRDLVHIHNRVANQLNYHHWIAIQRIEPVFQQEKAIPHQHFGALIYTVYDGSLNHIKTRSAYTYCPACDRTTKDYGGKKHTYHRYGTLISDVWRDEVYNPEGNLDDLYTRFADLFGLENYVNLHVLDCQSLSQTEEIDTQPEIVPAPSTPLQTGLRHGDCLNELAKIPDDSIDFAFVDPPYNLGKKYSGYADDMEIQHYFEWCDTWLEELYRVLKPGRTCALLNIPLWAVRHFLYLEKIMNFQNWIVWDALSYPVRKIMPAHYAILCFSKGIPRDLPGLHATSQPTPMLSRSSPEKYQAMRGMKNTLNCVRPWLCRKNVDPKSFYHA